MAVAPAESEQILKSEAVLAIKKTVRCSDEQAAMILQGREKHKLIEISVALTGGPLDARKQVPQVRLKWTAPPKSRKK